MGKKLICSAMAIVLIATSLSGCTKQTATSNNDVTTIRVWSSAGGTKADMSERIEKFNNGEGKDLGINIEYKVYTDDYKTIIDAAAQSDKLPEVLNIPGSKKTYALKGDIIPITELPGGKEYLDSYGEKAIEEMEKFDGKVYFVNNTATTLGLIYNKDLFKKAGLVDGNGEALAPQTWDEVREYAKRITSSNDKEYGISIPLKWSGLFTFMLRLPFSASFKDDIVKIDTKNFTYDYSNMKPAFEWLLNIKNDNSYFPGAESLDHDTGRAQFAEGRIGMFIGASWDVAVLTTQFKAICDWDVTEVPVINKGERYSYPCTVTSGYCISKNALKTDINKVKTVYEFLQSDALRRDQFEKGLDMPSRIEAIENADISNVTPQWVKFSSFLPKEIKRILSVSLKLEGDNEADIPMKLWYGSLTPDQAISNLNETYSSALKKGVSEGSIKLENK